MEQYKTFDPKQTNELLLIRHGWLSPEFELTDNVNSYGKLFYNWISIRTAMAESATGKWIFKMGYIFTRTIAITNENGELIGETKREIFSRRTVLTLQTGFTAEFFRPFFFLKRVCLGIKRLWHHNAHQELPVKLPGYNYYRTINGAAGINSVINIFGRAFNNFKKTKKGSTLIMAEKKAFVLRVNPDMLKEIESWAAAEFRSTNGQIEYLLQQAINDRKKKNKKSKEP